MQPGEGQGKEGLNRIQGNRTWRIGRKWGTRVRHAAPGETGEGEAGSQGSDIQPQGKLRKEKRVQREERAMYKTRSSRLGKRVAPGKAGYRRQDEGKIRKTGSRAGCGGTGLFDSSTWEAEGDFCGSEAIMSSRPDSQDYIVRPSLQIRQTSNQLNKKTKTKQKKEERYGTD